MRWRRKTRESAAAAPPGLQPFAPIPDSLLSDLAAMAMDGEIYREDRWPAVVTAEWLREHQACASGVAAFAAAWPEGMPLTVESLKRCRELRIDLDWAVPLLPRSVLRRRLRIRHALTTLLRGSRWRTSARMCCGR